MPPTISYQSASESDHVRGAPPLARVTAALAAMAFLLVAVLLGYQDISQGDPDHPWRLSILIALSGTVLCAAVAVGLVGSRPRAGNSQSDAAAQRQ